MIDKEVKELEEAVEQIWEIATVKFGLDPFPVNFEIVPSSVMYEIGSYAMPGRYSHWSFGKAYHRMKMMYDLGLSRIYEVVINSNPSYAFLLETNSPIQNKLVIAHVLGHVDFFKNNVYFSQTNRRMVDEAARHARRMEEYEFTHGRKIVEEFLDAVLSIDEHIDPNFFIRKEDIEKEKTKSKTGRDTSNHKYIDLYTEEELKALEGNLKKPAEQRGKPKARLPEKDLVYFILKHSPVLEDWQRDVMNMLHDEMEYFIPQMQTKTINEGWACAVGESLLPTENGFIRFDDLYEAREKIRIASGKPGEINWITAFHKEEQVPIIRIRTRRGFTIAGALKHRVLLDDGSWAYLNEVKQGDRTLLAHATNIWPEEYQHLPFAAAMPSATLNTVAALAGVSSATAIRHLHGSHKSRSAEALDAALSAVSYLPGKSGRVLPTRTQLNAPDELNEELAWFLGYFVGDGNLNKSGIGLTTGDEELVRRMGKTVNDLFGISCNVKLDKSDGHKRWRIVIYSREIWRLLEVVGINLPDKARDKKIPSLILRSPKSVMSAFLRGYFDADAYAGPEGIRLSSSSKELINTVQVVLLNYGILSTQREHLHDIRQLEIAGTSAAKFLEEIGFNLTRKQEALRKHVEDRRWFRKENLTDEIISIENDYADVYDITVDEKHSYVANGFVNHNSFWHSRIMREMDLPTDDHLEFAELHAGVVSPHRGQLNPYYLGYKILEDIEKRWDNPSQEEREKFGRTGGQGREKLFEVREADNDISFLRNYLTEELCEELDLFVYELVDEEEWTITDKKWERVRDQLVANMTNFGYPYIEVVDGDYNGNLELYMMHRYEGVELDMKYARKTLENVQKLWGRPVHLETTVDDESLVLHYDGEEHRED